MQPHSRPAADRGHRRCGGGVRLRSPPGNDRTSTRGGAAAGRACRRSGRTRPSAPACGTTRSTGSSSRRSASRTSSAPSKTGFGVLLGDPPIVWDEITAKTHCDDTEPTCLDFWIRGRDDAIVNRGRSMVSGGRRVIAEPGIPGTPTLSSRSGYVTRAPGGLGLSRWGACNPEVIALIDSDHARGTASEYVAELMRTRLAQVIARKFERGTVTCDPSSESCAPPHRSVGDRRRPTARSRCQRASRDRRRSRRHSTPPRPAPLLQPRTT